MGDHAAKRERLQKELDEEVTGRAIDNQRQNEAAVSRLRREAGPDSSVYKDRAAKAEDAQKQLRAIRAQVDSRPLRTHQAKLYPFVMLVLALESHEAPVACPAWIYHNRNRVERLWARLKEWRAVATRYEKTARSFLGVLCLAASLDWLKR
jgi:transposase